MAVFKEFAEFLRPKTAEDRENVVRRQAASNEMTQIFQQLAQSEVRPRGLSSM
jgi:hypothetical protein